MDLPFGQRRQGFGHNINTRGHGQKVFDLSMVKDENLHSIASSSGQAGCYV
jgi:hypothetical protein